VTEVVYYLVTAAWALVFVAVLVALASVGDESPRGTADDREPNQPIGPQPRSQPDEHLAAATSGTDLALGDLPRVAE
jgi:hypothetical protein